MPFDYEQKFRGAYAKNVADVGTTLSSGKIDRKIENFCELHDFHVNEVRTEIQNNKFLAACFAINPNKQNFYEIIAAEYISELLCVTSFKKLPTSELHVIDGKLFTRAEAQRLYRKSPSRKGEAKTIDFSWACGSIQFYAAHKYTKQEGGAQGNQSESRLNCP